MGRSTAKRSWLVLVAAALCLSALPPLPTQASTGLEGFDPGNLISDEAFFNPSAMSPEDIQGFIARQGSACVPGPDGTPCLKDYQADSPAREATKYCNAVAARPQASAADILADVSLACGINPQVLLVLLQKEQALITGSGERLNASRYTKATGLGCPDFQQCDPSRATFFGQVYGAAERFQIYRASPSAYRHRVGVPMKVAYNPETVCGAANLTIRNQATAGLYNYTPYVPNAAALSAVTGQGDLCSAYGNRNFYRYMKVWFPESMTSSTAAPVQATPASTVPPAMTAIYARAASAGTSVLGSPTGPITCASGRCSKPYANAAITWNGDDAARIEGKTPRLSGPSRYETAVAASRSAFPQGAPTVFLATGTSPADALAAGPWALGLKAPILLSDSSSLPQSVAAELTRLTPAHVVIVGGPLSISPAVADAVRHVLPDAEIERISGPTLYDTAVQISRAAFSHADVIYVATGRHFADALVAGPATGGQSPVLLVPGNDALPSAIAEEIRRLGATKIKVLGGANWISETTVDSLAAIASTERTSGTDRYATAALLASQSSLDDSTAVYIASGETYPDALVSVTLQSSQPGPVLLSQTTCLPPATVSYLRAHTTARITLVGGASTLSGEVAALLPCGS